MTKQVNIIRSRDRVSFEAERFSRLAEKACAHAIIFNLVIMGVMSTVGKCGFVLQEDI
jgi:hypothetical protein